MMTLAKFGNRCQRHMIACCLLLLSTTYSSASLAALTASVDRIKMTVDDTFTLIIRSTEASIFDSPDLSALDQDFKLLGNSRSSQTSIVNGRTESSMEWHISLSPKAEGALVIPPIEVDGEKTKAVIVEVGKSKPLTQSDDVNPVFMKAELDHEQMYVQAQALLTVRIYYAVALARGAQLSELEIPNAVVTQINEASFETRLKGMRYNVHEVKYAISPQRSGRLDIPAQVFSANIATQRQSSIFNNLGGSRGRSIKIQSAPLTLDVHPQADSFSGGQWLPAKNLVLEESWTKDPNDLKAGEPTTRTLTIVAEGLQGSQLPPLDIAELKNAQQYPDQAETSDEVSALGINGTRVESQAVIPSAGGDLTVPAVTVSWWNIVTDKQEIATIPARTYAISGPKAATPTQTPANTAMQAVPLAQPANPENATGNSSGGLWKYTTYLSLALWLATLAYFLLTQRKHATEEPKAQSNTSRANEEELLFTGLSRYQGSNNLDDFNALKAGLIKWGRTYTNKPNLSALAGLSSELGDSALTEQFSRLDAAIYQNDGENNQGASLDIGLMIDRIEQLRELKRKKKRPTVESLAPLYKTT